jgi:hypothetical protein
MKLGTAPDGVTVGEDADNVGAAADLLVEPFLGVVGPDLLPDLAGEGMIVSLVYRVWLGGCFRSRRC